MKLPLDFGVKLFFRLLLPGFVSALGFAPILFGAADALGLADYREAVFVIFIIIFGWVIIGADMPIYMLLEGRRFWPKWLRDWRQKKEESRLQKLNNIIAGYFKRNSGIDERRYLEASVNTRHFPIGQNGEPFANFPTRLGNTIDAFETYSYSRYGLDAIFYWPRIWVQLDKDTREEIDNQQAVADSAVYTSFALGVNAVLAMVYCVASLIEAAIGPVVLERGWLETPFSEGIFRYLPGAWVSAVLGLFSLPLAYGVYRLAVFRNEQFGTLFMAVMDAHVSKVRNYLPMDGIGYHVRQAAGDRLEPQSDFEITQRYLQYFRARLKGKERGVPMSQVQNQRK